MTQEEFNALQFGNVIADLRGNESMVYNVIRDEQGNATHVGIIDCLSPRMIDVYNVVSKAHCETQLVTTVSNDPAVIAKLAGKTIPEDKP